MRLSHLPALLIAVLLMGCTLERETTTDPLSPEGRTEVYRLDGRLMTVADLPAESDYRIRRGLLEIRRGVIYDWVLATAVADAGLAIDQEFEAHYMRYVEHTSGGKESLEQQLADAPESARGAFQGELMRRQRMYVLLMERQPLTEEERERVFASRTPEDWFARSGEMLGLTDVAQITPEALGMEIERAYFEEIASASALPLLDDLLAEYTDEGRLQIVRLPGEPEAELNPVEGESPPDDADTESLVARLATDLTGGRAPKSKPESSTPEPTTTDRVAFFGDGKPVTWSSILVADQFYDQVGQMKTAAVAIAVLSVLFEDYYKEGIDPKMVDRRIQRQVQQFGGLEAYEAQLQQDGLSLEVLRRLLENEVKVEYIVAKVYPVTEDDVKERYATQTPEEWFMQFRDELGFVAVRQATPGALRGVIEEQIRGEHNREFGQAVLEKAIERLIEIGRLEIPGREAAPVELPLIGLSRIRASETPSVAEVLAKAKSAGHDEPAEAEATPSAGSSH